MPNMGTDLITRQDAVDAIVEKTVFDSAAEMRDAVGHIWPEAEDMYIRGILAAIDAVRGLEPAVQEIQCFESRTHCGRRRRRTRRAVGRRKMFAEREQEKIEARMNSETLNAIAAVLERDGIAPLCSTCRPVFGKCPYGKRFAECSSRELWKEYLVCRIGQTAKEE